MTGTKAHFSETGDYFAAQMGFVIEGRQFGSKEKAAAYVENVCDMSPKEALNYLANLYNAYANRVRNAAMR